MRLRLSFGAKIAILVTALTAGMGIVIAVVVHNLLWQALHHEYETKGEGIVRNLTMSAEELLAADARTLLAGKLEQYRSVAGVRYIVVLDPGGEVITHTITPAFPQALGAVLRASSPSATDGTVKDEPVFTTIETIPEIGPVLDVGKPILLGLLGTAHVGMSMELIDSKVNNAVWALAGVILVFALAGVALSFIAGRLLDRPIRQMVRAMRRVAAGELEPTPMRARVRISQSSPRGSTAWSTLYATSQKACGAVARTSITQPGRSCTPRALRKPGSSSNRQASKKSQHRCALCPTQRTLLRTRRASYRR